ncbi:MAG: hypothetical protein ACRDIY_09925 [Chloroflexota bacterium]
MINVINRIIVSILLILLIVVLIPTAVTPDGVAAFFSLQLSLVKVDPISIDHLIVVVACCFLIALSAILLNLEWKRPRSRAVQIAGGGRKSAELATESVAERVEADVEALPQVHRAISRIVARGGVVDVSLEVRVDANVDVPAKAQEIDQVLRDSIGRMGLKLGKPRVKIVCVRGSSSDPTPAASE